MSLPTASSQTITARSGSNLALSFVSLPPERRRAMSIFYAFCRVIDDAADSETLATDDKRTQLLYWREEIRRAYLSIPESSLGKEMAEIIRTHLIPPTPLEDILNGVEMDLSIKRYRTFAELETYCYRVASAVGLVSIEIFSYRQTQTRDYAVALGMAFQLTNILRDVLKDAVNDRIYIPLDEMEEYGVEESDILQGKDSPALQKLLRFQYHRAKYYFAKSWRLIHPDDRPNLTAAEIMREVYEGILEKIHRDGFHLHNPPLRLNKLSKLACVFQARAREKKAAPIPSKPKKVFILGGGLSGLSTAFELVRRGHQVTVLESKPHLGGRTYSFKEAKSGEIVDNGQHILMGCYHSSLRFFRELGVYNKLLVQAHLEIHFQSSRGPSRLAAVNAPAPFHTLMGLIQYKELNWRDRLAALSMGLKLKLGFPPFPDETATKWLVRMRQTPNLIRALWEPLCLAALNQSLDVSSAELLARVLNLALFSGGSDSTLLLSQVGLSDLFSREISTVLNYCGSEIQLQSHIGRLNFSENRLEEVHTLDGHVLAPGYVVSTLPWNGLRGLLPEGSELKNTCAKFPDSTIISLYLWLDRPLEVPMIQGFLDSPLHWLFSREQIENRPCPGRHPYVAVISAANSLKDKTHEELEQLVIAELHRLLPSSREAKVVHRFVYKALSATFSATPEVERLRPGTATKWENFWLAGDWTNTGLPATIEGAIRSGQLAAEAVDAAP